jgi:peptidoglycan/LPS O-acetylase OafA/YrhL
MDDNSSLRAPEAASGARTNRLASLDVLRGVAIVLVLCQHMPASLAKGPLAALKLFGWTGVDLFFVLSGYLISSLLYRELNDTGSLGIGRFLLRRGLKIWPCYFVAYGSMCFARVISLLVRHRPDQARQFVVSLWPNLVFLQNYFPPEIRWPHSWSLAVEEHFYLGLPILLVALWKVRRSSSVPAICTVICCGVLLSRLVFVIWGGFRWNDLYYPTHFRMDGLACGVLIGYFKANRPSLFYWIASHLRHAVWVVLIIPVMALFFHENSLVIATIGFTLFYLGYGVLVIVGAADPQVFSGRRLRYISGPLSFLGSYSYTIYLAHSVIYEMPFITPLKWLFLRVAGVWGEGVLYFSTLLSKFAG